MLAIKKNVRKIKTILANNEVFDQSEWEKHAKEYAESCETLMNKAFFCNKLIRENKQKEADELAKRDPDLKELEKTVDFDRAVDWWLLCEKHRLPSMHLVIPETVSDVIATIYADASKMDLLLRKHRMLAIMHASMDKRLEVMRELAKVDAGNKFWREDIAEFEKILLKELKVKGEKAAKNSDYHSLKNLISIIKKGDWENEKEVEQVLGNLQKLVRPLHKKEIESQYCKLAESIVDSFNDMNVEDLLSLVAKWSSLVQKTGIKPSDQLKKNILPAMNFVSELKESRKKEAEFNKACSELEEYIEDGYIDISELDNLASRVLNFDQGMPEVLAAKYTSFRQELEKSDKRRFVIKVVVAASVLLSMAAGVGYFLWQSKYEEKVAKWQNMLSALIEENNIDKASAAVAEIEKNKKIVAEPEIKALLVEYDDLVAKENERKEQLAGLLSKFENTEVAKLSEYDIKRAESLARLDSEKNAVESFRQQSVNYKNNVTVEINKSFAEEIDTLEASLSSLNRNSDISQENKLKQVNDIISSVNKLMQKGGISNYNRTHAQGVLDAASSIAANTNSQIVNSKLLNELSNSYSNPEKYISLCEQYAQTSNDSVASDLNRCIAKEKAISAIIKWDELYQQWNSKWIGLDIDQASERASILDDSLDLLENMPNYSYIKQYAAYLSSYINFFDQSNGGMKYVVIMKKVLNKPVLTDAKVVSCEGVNYYVRTDFNINDGRSGDDVTVKYYSDIEGGTKTKVLSKRKTKVEFEIAPHVVIVGNQILSSLNSIDKSNWLTAFTDMALLCIQADNIDPVFSVSFVKMTNSFTQQLSPFESINCQKINKSLEDIDTDVNWMDPADSDAETVRSKSKHIIKDMVDVLVLEGVIKDLVQKQSEMLANFDSYIPVAVKLSSVAEIKIGDIKTEIPVYHIAFDSENNFIMEKAGKYYIDKIIYNDKCLEGDIVYISRSSLEKTSK